ncbi:MAG: YtxH domain-containing protein [Bacteroidota bacterium]
MRKDILTFIVGLTAGAVLGMLVEDKNKKRVQEALNKHIKQLLKKYEDLSQEGVDMVKEGIDKIKSLKKST